MDFFSLDFIIFFSIALFVYYIISPRKRRQWLHIVNFAFWLTQTYFTLILAGLCLLFDLFLLRKSSKSNSYLGNSLIFLPYIVLIFVYYFFPLPSEQLNASLYPSAMTNRFLPCGLFVMCFQSIRNINLIRNGRVSLNDLSFSSWVKMQLFFISYYCGPINNLDYFISEVKGERTFSFDSIVMGFKLLFWALLKKMVIADRLLYYMTSYSNGSVAISGVSDLLVAIFVPFFYITFTVGAYCSLGKSLGYFLGINILRNIDIYAYLTGIGNFWSRWIITLKQTLDEIFIDYKYCKLIVYSLLLFINLMIFNKSSYVFYFLPFFAIFIYLDFYFQENAYFNSRAITITVKLFSFVLISLFWNISFLHSFPNLELIGKFNSLSYFNNSDFLIFFIILIVIVQHILRRKLKSIKFYDSSQFEDISLVGVVFLGYFVLMFGVF